MDILAKLFGSKDRVRIMRLLLAQEKNSFQAKDIVRALKLDLVETKRELKLLAGATFAKEVTVLEEVVKRGGAREKNKVAGYALNPRFTYLSNFKNLLLEKEELAPTQLYEQFKKFGTIELFVVTGMFQGRSTREIDLLIVGKKLRRDKIEQKIAELESMLGGEIKYALYESDEFAYRYMMYDRFVREVLIGEHTAVVNTLNLN